MAPKIGKQYYNVEEATHKFLKILFCYTLIVDWIAFYIRQFPNSDKNIILVYVCMYIYW